MKAMYISLGLLGHDGRQRELLDILKAISDVDVIAPNLGDDIGSSFRSNLTVKDRNERTSLLFYFKFMWVALAQSYKKKYDFIFIDDYQASIVGVFLSLLHRKKIIITDSREFYYQRKMPGLGKWLVKAERLLIKKSHIVIAANTYRADMMRILYGIKTPLVFDNLREIVIGSSEKIEKKQDGIFRLVSTGGCSLERGTLELVKAVGNHKDINLLIIGKGNNNDYQNIVNEMEKRNITNVSIIDRVPFKDLCNILMSYDGGIIEYHMNDLNNYFCASGKVFEYISIGMPVITTPNPPLAHFINENHCGVVAFDFDWNKGITKFKNEFDTIKKSAVFLSKSVDSKSHREKFAVKLLGNLNSLTIEKEV
jgi:hypothetical protein